MAERRMFSKKITESDAFLDMPMSTQALYFHLNMSADDDGFVNNPKKIQRMIGASEDDLKLLLAKSFIISFDTGVIVIKHWRMHNYIQKDRYHPTDYQEEMALLSEKPTKAYTLDTDCIQVGSGMCTEDRLGKESIDKGSIGKNDICSQASKKPVEPEADVEAIVLNTGEEWRPTEERYREYCRLYPAVDVKQEFRSMRGWCLDNPKKRKTRSGVSRFVNSWLSRTQNSGGTPGYLEKSKRTSESYGDALGKLLNEDRGDLNV